ncbi:MAG: KEOPS complex subunit Cgi121 [Haloarculaceae archaeon]
MEVVEGVATVEDVEAFVASLQDVAETHDLAVQAFDARYVVDRTHLERAVTLANRAFERGDAIADDRAVEILCYAAGRRQIDRAMTMGVASGEAPVAVVVDGGPDDHADREAAAAAAIADLLDPASTLDAFDEDSVREFFDVSEAELAAAGGDLAGIVHERVALLVVNR